MGRESGLRDSYPTHRSAGRGKKVVFTDAEIARLTAAARGHGPEALIVCLLALDAGLRVSEICALEWADLDLEAGTMIVQCNTYRGEKQTPKGTIGTITLTKAHGAALVKHRKREPIGTLVLYRRRLGQRVRTRAPSPRASDTRPAL